MSSEITNREDTNSSSSYQALTANVNTSHLKTSLLRASNLLVDFLQSDEQLAKLMIATQLMVRTLQNGNKIISCGNGGSMCDAMHFAEELTGRFKLNRTPLAALSISDPAHLSCTANDFGYDEIFTRFLVGIGKPGDLLLAISTSGNSNNIINAVNAAKEKQIEVVALLGKGGGKLKDMGIHHILIPDDSSERIQEMHIKLIHLMVEGIERELFPEHYLS